jgi:ketosteroid isomerase-like protein
MEAGDTGGIRMSFKIECQAIMKAYVSAYRNRDAAGCTAVFTENARLMSPYGPPVQGRDAIEQTHRDWVIEGAESKEITIIEAGCDGAVGWCLGVFSEGEAETGTSLNVLERQPEGHWLIRQCSLNEAP